MSRRLHRSEDKYCDECCKDVQSIRSHRRRHHQSSCMVTFLDKYSEVLKVKREDDGNFHCPRCSLRFGFAQDLQKHTRRKCKGKSNGQAAGRQRKRSIRTLSDLEDGSTLNDDPERLASEAKAESGLDLQTNTEGTDDTTRTQRTFSDVGTEMILDSMGLGRDCLSSDPAFSGDRGVCQRQDTHYEGVHLEGEGDEDQVIQHVDVASHPRNSDADGTRANIDHGAALSLDCYGAEMPYPMELQYPDWDGYSEEDEVQNTVSEK